MGKLPEEVEFEIDRIQDLLKSLNSTRDASALNALELAGLAAIIHGFYNGVENIIKHMSRNRNLALPLGDTWHRDLLDLSVNEKLISSKLAADLREFLAFRHFFRHSYSFELNPEKIQPLLDKLIATFESFKKQINRL